MTRRLILATIVALAVTNGGTVATQTKDLLPPMFVQSIEYFRGRTIADLEAQLAYYKASLPSAVANYNAWKGKWYADGHLREVQAVLDRIQQAMAERNVVVRPTWHEGEAGAITGTAAEAAEGAGLGGGSGGGGAGRGGGGNTLPNGVPRNNGNTLKMPKPGASPDETLGGLPAFAVAATVVLTTAQLAQCSLAGKDLSACASELALRTVGALATGVFVKVALPAAVGTGLTAVAFVVTAGATVVEVTELGVESVRGAGAVIDEAAANAHLREAQARNLSLLTPDKTAALVAGFRAQLDAIDRQNAETRPWFDQVAAAGAALDDIVAEIRREIDEIRADNNLIDLAASQCRNPLVNPVGLLVELETRAKAMSDTADRIERGAGEASRLVESCPTAADARRRYDQAQRDKADLHHMFADSSQDMADAATFFKVVKAGRAAVADAEKRAAALDKRVEEARQTGARLQELVAIYTGERNKANGAHMRLAASAQALHTAVARPAPSHIESALSEIDAMHPRPVAAFDNDELRVFARLADTEVNRAEGLAKQAAGTLKDLRACENIADEMPESLRREMTQLGSEMSRHMTRAQTALANAKDVPAKADACATSPQPAGGDGQMSGRCSGTITADPLEGKPGTPFHLTVQITGPEAASISRVLVDNPGCTTARCRDTASRGKGAFDIWLGFQAPPGAEAVNGVIAEFRVKFQAFIGEALTCSGQSRLLKVLAR